MVKNQYNGYNIGYDIAKIKFEVKNGVILSSGSKYK